MAGFLISQLITASATTEVELINNSDWQSSAILHSSEDATNDEMESIEQYQPLQSLGTLSCFGRHKVSTLSCINNKLPGLAFTN